MPTTGRKHVIAEAERNDSIPHFTKQVKAGVPGALKSLARQSKKFTPGHDEYGFPRKSTGKYEDWDYSKSKYKKGGKITKKKK